MGSLAKVYFGSHTNIEPRDEHLNLPDAGKLFFISPPPSPPQGWEMKMEDAPNKLVHADDLAEALAKLHNRPAPGAELSSPVSDSVSRNGRTRSSSTTIYDPNEHGNSPGLPAISVTTEGWGEDEEELSPLTMEKPIIAHTTRPPVELMS